MIHKMLPLITILHLELLLPVSILFRILIFNQKKSSEGIQIIKVRNSRLSVTSIQMTKMIYNLRNILWNQRKIFHRSCQMSKAKNIVLLSSQKKRKLPRPHFMVMITNLSELGLKKNIILFQKDKL